MSNKKGYSAIILILLIALGVGIMFATNKYMMYRQSTFASNNQNTAIKGNGAPSGAHYNLNIIGVPKGKTADMTGGSGRRIFVPLTGKCNIKLSEGAFQVLDANCTDNNQATFQLPNPDPENDGITEYSVWASVQRFE